MPQPVSDHITSSGNSVYQPYDAADSHASANATPFRKLQSGPLNLADGSFRDPPHEQVGGWGHPGLAARQSDGVSGMPRGGWMQT